jgi:hypothetical protein
LQMVWELQSSSQGEQTSAVSLSAFKVFLVYRFA